MADLQPTSVFSYRLETKTNHRPGHLLLAGQTNVIPNWCRKSQVYLVLYTLVYLLIPGSFQLILSNFEQVGEDIRTPCFHCVCMFLVRSLVCNSCVPGMYSVLVRAYVYMQFHVFTLISIYFGCTICFSCYDVYFVVIMVTEVMVQRHRQQWWSYYSTTMDTHGRSSTPPRIEVVSGLVRPINIVPSRRFREHGRCASMLATGGGRQDKYSWRSCRCETNEAW